MGPVNELEYEVRAISEYVRAETGEGVNRAERMMSTKILGHKHELWDVHTDSGRYWVVTNPNNLYLQEDHKSADACLTFHVGLSLRLTERARVEIDADVRQHVGVPWRKYEQAVGAFNSADEAEAFQAVGIHCREALLALAREFMANTSTGEDAPAPKAGDFGGWADVAAEQLATGRLRAYVRAIAKSTWDLTLHLQHDSEATPWDAELALDATAHAINVFGLALLRHDLGKPDRCPRCGSYRVDSDQGVTNEDSSIQWTVEVCGACEHRWDQKVIRWDDTGGWVETGDPGAHAAL